MPTFKYDDEELESLKESIEYDVRLAKQHMDNLEEFFKSRLAYVIENTLKYIELSDFLDHIVKNDENIIYSELREMILSIFGEINSECVVLLNANRSAKK